ncbi:apoptogenic protein 1, partial [Tremellales sp. Uapishka_1]
MLSASARVCLVRFPTSVSRNAFASTSAASSPTTTTTSRRRRAERVNNGDDVDLVAPPDPYSNMRPVIYASTSTKRRSSTSPYSTSEFPSSIASNSGELELEWRLRRERVDAMNHRYWSAMNSEFNAQREHRLSLLPPASDPPSELDIRRTEDCLSQFYADWQIANRTKMGKWVKEWWREIWSGLKMQSKVYLSRGWRR